MDSQQKKPKQSKNKNNHDTSEELKYISSLINQGKFKEALERIESDEKKNPNNKNLQFNKLGFLVDIGFGLNDQKIIRQELNIGEQNLKNQKNTEHLMNNHHLPNLSIRDPCNNELYIPLEM